MTPKAPLIDRLYTDIEWARAQGQGPRELLPLLKRLAREAPAASPHGAYARLNLAELLVRRDPFRSARLASDALAAGESDRAYAVLGLAHMLLGNFRMAERAYRTALSFAPGSPTYCHNLGHLLDIGLNRPKEALGFLRAARHGLPDEREVASSLAHALLASGDDKGALREVTWALQGDETRGLALLAEWRESLGRGPEWPV